MRRQFLIVLVLALAPTALAKTFRAAEGREAIGMPEGFVQLGPSLWQERDGRGKVLSIARLHLYHRAGASSSAASLQQSVHETVLQPLGWDPHAGAAISNVFDAPAMARRYYRSSVDRWLLTIACMVEARPCLMSVESREEARITAFLDVFQRESRLESSWSSRREDLENRLKDGPLRLSAAALEGQRVALCLTDAAGAIPFLAGDLRFRVWAKDEQELHPEVTASAFALSIGDGGVDFGKDAHVISVILGDQELARTVIARPAR